MQSTNSTAFDSPVSPDKASPRTLSFDTLQQSATLLQVDPPRQSRIQKSSRPFQTVNIKFLPNTSSAPPSFIIKEPGLLGKKVSYLFGHIETRIGYSATISELLFGVSCLDNWRTLSSYGITADDTGAVTLEVDQFRGKKPVIYLYPPFSLADVTIELALASSWRFSAVHPPPQTTIPPGQPHTAQCVTWTVAAEPNGTLVDKLKHEYIALRFIAQEPYEKAAAMRITPAPDIVTRVFVLFRRAAAGDLALSEPARARTAEGDGATFWVDEVGVDAARAADSGWFRVLEWGGTEVH